MSLHTSRPWPTRSRVRRRGAQVVVVALLAGVAGVGTVLGRDEPTRELTGPSLDEVRAYAEHPDLPVTYEEARAAGTLDNYDWGEYCDETRPYNDTETTLARIAIPSVYAPPCVPVWGGDRPWESSGGHTFDDNGGVTAPGVTAETIRVAYYLPSEQDVTRQLESFDVLDSDRETLDGLDELVEMSNHIYETYGRRVEVVPFRATGDGSTPTIARADAVRVAEMDVFASIGGPTQTSAYQHELARNQILCIQCGYASTDDVMATDAPYAWGYQATPDQLLFGALGAGGVLDGQPAQFAGDPDLRSQIRNIAVVHYEQDPPIFGALGERARARFVEEQGEEPLVISYILDASTLNVQAQAIIGRLKREGVTSVVFLGDPLMPRLLTQQATRQDYHPEWIFTGTVFTDTTAVARLYDQEQMAHAFGMSSNPARTSPEASESWQLHQWWHGTEPGSPNTLMVWGPVIQQLFIGIHMAGPHLTAETFAGGLFNYPPTGGTDTVGMNSAQLFLGGYLAGDTTPAISYGPGDDDNEPVDYVAIDDFTTSWWDPDAVGPDENGVVGRGMWQYTGLGVRRPFSDPELPEGVTEDYLFQTMLSGAGGETYEAAQALGLDDLQIAVDILDETPPLDQVPDYPTRPEAPAD